MTICKQQGEVYLGKELIGRDVHSNETAQLVDSEIRGFITRAYERALVILKKRRELLEKLAGELFEKETLRTEEFFEFILAEAAESDLEQVRAQYTKARELRFEHSEKLAADATPPPESASGRVGDRTLPATRVCVVHHRRHHRRRLVGQPPMDGPRRPGRRTGFGAGRGSASSASQCAITASFSRASSFP